MIKRLKRELFDLFILGMRTFGHEKYIKLSFWSNLNETIIGFVAQDQMDDLYAYGILMRDGIGRFRFCEGEMNFSKEHIARKALKKKIRELTRFYMNKDTIFIQGDEPPKYIDLLQIPKSTPTEKLHPAFLRLTQNPAYLPAKKVIEELSHWIQPKDLHLEKEFQTTAFDQRIWELYLWAALKELSFDINQLEAPDFLCKRSDIPLFTIEATTSAPSTSGPLVEMPDEPHDLESVVEYNNEYMALKYGSSLTSKLNKQPPYWERPETKGIPFILAIADFHRPDYETLFPSMIYTHSALHRYLYGLDAIVKRDHTGSYFEEYKIIKEHKYADKTIPSGFFNLPHSENISGVLFCNAGTIAKFNRMGVLAGFGLPNYRYIRTGEKYNISDLVATEGIPSSIDIQHPSYHETWFEELNLFHNPNARLPLNPNLFENINQHYRVNNHFESSTHETWIYSVTSNIRILSDDEDATPNDSIDKKWLKFNRFKSPLR